jgi:hypothetical protein
MRKLGRVGGGEILASVQVRKVLPLSPLSKNLKIRICKTVILPLILYGCKTCFFTLKET